MKMSFSLSSLQPSAGSNPENLERVGLTVDRPYNSLTKKRKDPKTVHNRRMWANREDCKDDFWAAIRSNYDYIMDTNLIDSCKEANGELTWDETDVSTQSWSLKEVSGQFSELYSWLRVLQEMVYSKEENLLDKSLRAAHMEELKRKAYRRKLFNEQAAKLVLREPVLRDEVAWRVDHLNAKWELVEQIMAPIDRSESNQQDVSADFEHEVKCLRKWLREMESRLQPLNFHTDWTLPELEEKAMEHMVLQRDIEAHGRIVSSVVKLSERVHTQQQLDKEQTQPHQVLRIASSLERRWHLLFLRALEWQCHIETLASHITNKNALLASTTSTAGGYRCSSDESDEEPVTKQPRLSGSNRLLSTKSTNLDVDDTGGGSESAGSQLSSSSCNERFERTKRVIRRRSKTNRRKSQREDRRSQSQGPTATIVEFLSDSEASSSFSDQTRSVIDDGSYFEDDDLCQMCAIETKSEGSSEKSERITSPSRIITPVLGDQGEEADIEEGAASEEEVDDMPPTPNTVPIATSTTIDDHRNCDEIDSPMTTKIERRSKVDSPLSPDGLKRRRHNTEEVASFNTSNRKSKNCATFYFKHLDTDSEADCSQPMNEESPNAGDDSSEEEWTYTANTTTTASSEKQLVTMERRKTNVVVRLDFGESPRVERTENLRFVSNVTEKMEPTLMERDETNDEIPANLIDDSSKENRNKGDESEDNDDKTSIQKLIKEVEKLVREERRTGVPRTFPQLIFDDEGTKKSNHRAKYARIKEWLKLNSARSYDNSRTASQYWLQPLDSCDASGEYTTEESDVERHSVLSDGPHSNISSYRHLDNELNGFDDLKVGSKDMFVDPDKTPINERKSLVPSIPDTSTPKVIMRAKQKTVNGPRPWSISCISHFGNKTDLNQTNDSISQFSISETALHQLIPSTCMKSGCSDVTGSRKSFDNSTSTLLEESINEKDGRVMRNSSLRRKKSRLRKKNLGRKSESSSDSVNANHHNHNNSAGSDGSSHNQQRLLRKTNYNRTMCGMTSGIGDCQGRRFTTLVKSGSFSGCIAHQQLVERTIVSDPTPPFRLPCCCNSVHASTSETEEEEQQPRPCNRERAGCTTTYEESLLDTVLSSKKLCDSRFNGGDSDVEMNSLGNNSFSEQAWDNYQEKYMSEPYSEAPDVETARRLLDFGDDYRNFLDSQSDCASSMSAVPGSSPALPRNRMHHTVTYTTDDSDSDTEDIRNVVEKSQSQLVLSENLFLRSNGTLPEDHSEMETACRENLKCLHKLLESSNGSLRGEKYVKQVRGMIERWESLSSRVEEAQKANTLHRELNAMHMEFKAVYDRLMSYEIALDQPHVLDERINRVTVELTTLRDRKPAMLALNVSTHRLITDLGTSASFIVTALKDSVADLYRVWDETFQKGNQQLCALQAVQQFSTRLAELQCALQRDKDTLAVLDVALQAGATSEVASSVRHVARLLSEKQDVSCQNDSIVSTESSAKEEQEEELMLTINSTTIGSTQEGGSLSDSGISDSGSEQELSERERRLAALRRLTRSLETQLIPGSEALVELWKRVEDAEVELRDLQRKCRELIVRTAASVETRGVNKRNGGQTIAHWGDKRRKDSSVTGGAATNDKLRKFNKTGATDSGDPEDEPGTPRSWVWRILRAALPFQLALVALFCAACLLEPHCCEATNTLHFSMTPQLRYVRGPPPV